MEKKKTINISKLMIIAIRNTKYILVKNIPDIVVFNWVNKFN